jgi:hypothetical protein
MFVTFFHSHFVSSSQPTICFLVNMSSHFTPAMPPAALPPLPAFGAPLFGHVEAADAAGPCPTTPPLPFLARDNIIGLSSRELSLMTIQMQTCHFRRYAEGAFRLLTWYYGSGRDLRLLNHFIPVPPNFPELVIPLQRSDAGLVRSSAHIVKDSATTRRRATASLEPLDIFVFFATPLTPSFIREQSYGGLVARIQLSQRQPLLCRRKHPRTPTGPTDHGAYFMPPTARERASNNPWRNLVEYEPPTCYDVTPQPSVSRTVDSYWGPNNIHHLRFPAILSDIPDKALLWWFHEFQSGPLPEVTLRDGRMQLAPSSPVGRFSENNYNEFVDYVNHSIARETVYWTPFIVKWRDVLLAQMSAVNQELSNSTGEIGPDVLLSVALSLTAPPPIDLSLFLTLPAPTPSNTTICPATTWASDDTICNAYTMFLPLSRMQPFRPPDPCAATSYTGFSYGDYILHAAVLTSPKPTAPGHPTFPTMTMHLHQADVCMILAHRGLTQLARLLRLCSEAAYMHGACANAFVTPGQDYYLLVAGCTGRPEFLYITKTRSLHQPAVSLVLPLALAPRLAIHLASWATASAACEPRPAAVVNFSTYLGDLPDRKYETDTLLWAHYVHGICMDSSKHAPVPATVFPFSGMHVQDQDTCMALRNEWDNADTWRRNNTHN